MPPGFREAGRFLRILAEWSSLVDSLRLADGIQASQKRSHESRS